MNNLFFNFYLLIPAPPPTTPPHTPKDTQCTPRSQTYQTVRNARPGTLFRGLFGDHFFRDFFHETFFPWTFFPSGLFWTLFIRGFFPRNLMFRDLFRGLFFQDSQFKFRVLRFGSNILNSENLKNFTLNLDSVMRNIPKNKFQKNTINSLDLVQIILYFLYVGHSRPFRPGCDLHYFFFFFHISMLWITTKNYTQIFPIFQKFL